MMLQLDIAITVTIYGAKSAEENIYQGVVIESSRIGDVTRSSPLFSFISQVEVRIRLWPQTQSNV